MSSEEEYQRKADALLRLATSTDNMRERSQLIDEAMRWHNLAMEEHDGKLEPANDDEDDLLEDRG
jgi:hypothetical protein